MSEYFIYNGELYHYGVKGMKWGVRRAKARQYRQEYHDMNKNRSTTSKVVNRLAGSDRAYASAKLRAERPAKTSGIGSGRSTLNKAQATGTVAAMEAKAKGATAREAGKIGAEARNKVIRDARAANAASPKNQKRKERENARRDFLSSYSTGQIVATGIVHQMRNILVANIASGTAAKLGYGTAARVISTMGTVANVISAANTARDLKIKRTS